jgi:cbb3-type cytochrome oxidase cytochrome c subunit
MKRGEKGILALISVLVIAGMLRSVLITKQPHDQEIPFYTNAEPALGENAMAIYHQYGCRNCHTLWTMKDSLQSVPAPILDGIGSLRSEDWLYKYLSSPNPQTILPSRLKLKYRMPSYADMPESDRRTMAKYLASLRVKDWYLEQLKKSEYEKLTGLKAPDEP